jgi:hypothetical protein
MCDTVLPIIMPTLRRFVRSGLKIGMVLRAPCSGPKNISRDFLFQRNEFSITVIRAAFDEVRYTHATVETTRTNHGSSNSKYLTKKSSGRRLRPITEKTEHGEVAKQGR